MLRIGARAKINWTLDITGRRADGYHLMDMLMQSVTLADEITLEKTADGIITLTTGGTPLLPADEHHLALRAARALQKAASCPLGARIHVVKHIPVGAGMGGGSSDAAGVLVGLNRLWETGLTRAEAGRCRLDAGSGRAVLHPRRIDPHPRHWGSNGGAPLRAVLPAGGDSAVRRAFDARCVCGVPRAGGFVPPGQ